MTDKLTAALDTIDEANPEDTASIITCAVRRLGQHGREGAEALLRAMESGTDSLVEEGIAQFGSVEGVLSGRTDAL
jgi:hypothetical protein